MLGADSTLAPGLVNLGLRGVVFVSARGQWNGGGILAGALR